MKRFTTVAFLLFLLVNGYSQTNMTSLEVILPSAPNRIIPIKQNGFYIKVHGGYNWPGFQNNATVMGANISAASAAHDGLVAMANVDDSLHSYQQVHGSYAAGANISFGVGYMINNWFGVEIGAHYLWNSSVSSHIRSDMSTIGFNGMFLNADMKTYSKNGLSLTPLLVFVVPKNKLKIQPQAKLGLVLPVYGKVIHEIEINSPLSIPVDPYYVGNRTSVVMQTESTFSIGITGSVGLRYTPIPFITVFADMTGQWLNIRAKKTQITQWDAYDNNTGQTYDMINGNPNDPNYNVRPLYRTQFEYVDHLTAASNNDQYNSNYDQNKPKQDARITAPASNIGIQVGIQFNLNKSILDAL